MCKTKDQVPKQQNLQDAKDKKQKKKKRIKLTVNQPRQLPDTLHAASRHRKNPPDRPTGAPQRSFAAEAGRLDEAAAAAGASEARAATNSSLLKQKKIHEIGGKELGKPNRQSRSRRRKVRERGRIKKLRFRGTKN